MPDNWQFVIAIAKEPQEKIVKMRENEDNILRNLKLMPKETSDMLSRIVLVKIIPSMVEGDLKSFGEGLTAFNSELGKFWNEYQCGRTYCHPVVEEAIKIMLTQKHMCLPDFLGSNMLWHSGQPNRSPSPQKRT